MKETGHVAEEHVPFGKQPLLNWIVKRRVARRRLVGASDAYLQHMRKFNWTANRGSPATIPLRFPSLGPALEFVVNPAALEERGDLALEQIGLRQFDAMMKQLAFALPKIRLVYRSCDCLGDGSVEQGWGLRCRYRPLRILRPDDDHNSSLYGTIESVILLSSMQKKPFTPTREEIAILTAQIRATWTEAETRMRIAKVTGLFPRPDRSKSPLQDSDDILRGGQCHDDTLDA